MQWYGNFLQAFRADVANSVISDSLVLQEIASPIDVDNVIVGPTQAQLANPLNMVSCFAGGIVQNSLFARFSLASSGTYANIVSFCKNIAFNSVKTLTLLNRGNQTSGTWTCTQNTGCAWSTCMNIGGRRLHTTDVNCTILSDRYADAFSGTTGTGTSHSAVVFTGGCNGLEVSGMDFIELTNVHPYDALVSVTASYNIKIRNFGTTGAALNLGSANATGLIVTSGGNNDTIRVSRCYTSNTRTGAWAFVNSDNNITLETVAGDYADTTVFAALNGVIKGARLTGATTGQTSVYGTHWKDSFTSATVGKIEVLCNEPTTASAAQCAVTAGTPRFNSAGQVALTTVGDQVTWEMPYFARGHNALANLAITLTGTNTNNVTYEFQYDKGAGYNGSWLTLNATNLNGAGAITPATGVRLKVRATCATTNANNLLTNIAIPTVTSASDQNQQYPLDQNTVTFIGLPAGCDIVVLSAGTATILDQRDAHPSNSYGYVFSGSQNIDIGFLKPGYVPYYIRNLALTAVDSSIPVTLTADRNYA
jgi:hypothetical protein